MYIGSTTQSSAAALSTAASLISFSILYTLLQTVARILLLPLYILRRRLCLISNLKSSLTSHSYFVGAGREKDN